jgi:hypothetical protein
MVSVTLVQPVKAYDEAFYSSNDILFYNPDASSSCSSTASTSTASVPLTDNPPLKQIFQLLINGGMNAGQASAVMGNMYAESGFNSDRHEIGNDLGYGLVQWTNHPIGSSTGRRTNLEKFAASKGVPNSDIPMQIEYLLNEYNSSYKSSLNSTPFKDGTDIAASTKAWMMIFEIPAMSPANDPAALNSKRIPAADTIYGLYSSLAPLSSGVTTSGCNVTGNGAVAGNIVATALNLALTSPVKDGTTSKSDARDTYQTAKQQYNPTTDWTDCGGFVSTVMKASGVDPNYPLGTSVEADYVRAHPEKYTIINNPSLTGSDLQPGDILISTTAGHTMLYTGQTGTPYADASLGGRVPSVRLSTDGVWMLQRNAFIARVIK